MKKIAAFATQGSGGGEEARLRDLLGAFEPVWIESSRTSLTNKLATFQRIIEWIARQRPELVVMEGTGIAGGMALILARILYGTSFVVSSGDAVGPYVGGRVSWLRWPFEIYEFLLYRLCAGFIGWTPYLAGRALSRGAPRVMTAPGWAPFELPEEKRERERRRIRESLGIPPDALVLGLIGSLAWNRRVRYCYGHEILQAFKRCPNPRAYGLIVGAGEGYGILLAEAERAGLQGRVILPGSVSREAVPAYLAAMDVVSLPQSCDQVGSFRYTTKLPEYLSAGLPVITGGIPLAYDLDEGWLWRLPGDSPWSEKYVSALATWLGTITPEEIARRAARVPRRSPLFDRKAQIERVTAFIRELELGANPE